MMIKHLYELLQILLKQNAKTHIKTQKSRLLIYDVYLKKYVSAEELLIPAQTKDSIDGPYTWKKSRDLLLFHLLMKKFINPKLDILSPAGVNINDLSKILDSSKINEYRYASTLKNFWGKGSENKTLHVPALPSTNARGNETEESAVGWAGQVTTKPETNPRPELSTQCSALGPGGSPDKNSRKNEKDKNANEKSNSIKYDKNSAKNGALLYEGKSERKKKGFSAQSIKLQKDKVLQAKSKSKLLAKRTNIKYNIFNKSNDALTKLEKVPNSNYTYKNEAVKVKTPNKEEETLFKRICSQMFIFGKFRRRDSEKAFKDFPILQGKAKLSKDETPSEKNFQNKKSIAKSNTSESNLDKRVKEHHKIAQIFTSSRNTEITYNNTDSSNRGINKIEGKNDGQVPNNTINIKGDSHLQKIKNENIKTVKYEKNEVKQGVQNITKNINKTKTNIKTQCVSSTKSDVKVIANDENKPIISTNNDNMECEKINSLVNNDSFPKSNLKPSIFTNLKSVTNIINKNVTNIKTEWVDSIKTDIKIIANNDTNPTIKGKANALVINKPNQQTNSKPSNLNNFINAKISPDKFLPSKINSLNNLNFNFIFPPTKIKSTISIYSAELNFNPKSKHESNIINTTNTNKIQPPVKSTGSTKSTLGSNSSTGEQGNTFIKNIDSPKRGSSLTNIKINEKVNPSDKQSKLLEKTSSASNFTTFKQISPSSKDSKSNIKSQNTNSHILKKDNIISSGLKKHSDGIIGSVAPLKKINTQREEEKDVKNNTVKSCNIDTNAIDKLHTISAQGKYFDDLVLEGELNQYNIGNYRGFKVVNSNSDALATKKNIPEKSPPQNDFKRSNSQLKSKDETLGKLHKLHNSTEFKDAVAESKKHVTNNITSLNKKSLINGKSRDVKSLEISSEVNNVKDQEVLKNKLLSNKYIKAESKDITMEVNKQPLTNKNTMAVSIDNTENIVKQDKSETNIDKANKRNESTEETSSIHEESTKINNYSVKNKSDHRIRYNLNKRKVMKPITFKYSMKKSRKPKASKNQEKIKNINHKEKKENAISKLHKEQVEVKVKVVNKTKESKETSQSVSNRQLNNQPQRSKSIPVFPQKENVSIRKQENKSHNTKTKSVDTLLTPDKVQSGKQTTNFRGDTQNASNKNIFVSKSHSTNANVHSSRTRKSLSDIKYPLNSKSKISNRFMNRGNKKRSPQPLDKINVIKGKIITKESLASKNQFSLNKSPSKSKNNISNTTQLANPDSTQRKKGRSQSEGDKSKRLGKKRTLRNYGLVSYKNIHLSKEEMRVNTNKEKSSQIDKNIIPLKPATSLEVNKRETNTMSSRQYGLKPLNNNERSRTHNQKDHDNISKKTAPSEKSNKIVRNKSSPELSNQIKNNKHFRKKQSDGNLDLRGDQSQKLNLFKQNQGSKVNISVEQEHISEEISGRTSKTPKRTTENNTSSHNATKYSDEFGGLEKNHSIKKPNKISKSVEKLGVRHTKELVKPEKETKGTENSISKILIKSKITRNTTKKNVTNFKNLTEDEKTKHSSHSLKLVKSNQSIQSSEKQTNNYKLVEYDKLNKYKTKIKESLINVKGNNNEDNQQSMTKKMFSSKKVNSSEKINDMTISRNKEINNSINKVNIISDGEFTNNNSNKDLTPTQNGTANTEGKTGEKSGAFVNISKENLSANYPVISKKVNNTYRTGTSKSTTQNESESSASPSESRYQDKSVLISRGLNGIPKSKEHQNEPSSFIKNKSVEVNPNNKDHIRDNSLILPQIKKVITLEKYIKEHIKSHERYKKIKNVENETYDVTNENYNQLDGAAKKNIPDNSEQKKTIADSKYSIKDYVNKNEQTISYVEEPQGKNKNRYDLVKKNSKRSFNFKSETSKKSVRPEKVVLHGSKMSGSQEQLNKGKNKITMLQGIQQTVYSRKPSYKQQPSNEGSKKNVLNTIKQTASTPKTAHQEPNTETNSPKVINDMKKSVNTPIKDYKEPSRRINTPKVLNSTKTSENTSKSVQVQQNSENNKLKVVKSIKESANNPKAAHKDPISGKNTSKLLNSIKQIVNNSKKTAHKHPVQERNTPKVRNSIKQTVNSPKENYSSEINIPEMLNNTKHPVNTPVNTHKKQQTGEMNKPTELNSVKQTVNTSIEAHKEQQTGEMNKSTELNSVKQTVSTHNEINSDAGTFSKVINTPKLINNTVNDLANKNNASNTSQKNSSGSIISSVKIENNRYNSDENKIDNSFIKNESMIKDLASIHNKHSGINISKGPSVNPGSQKLKTENSKFADSNIPPNKTDLKGNVNNGVNTQTQHLTNAINKHSTHNNKVNDKVSKRNKQMYDTKTAANTLVKKNNEPHSPAEVKTNHFKSISKTSSDNKTNLNNLNSEQSNIIKGSVKTNEKNITDVSNETQRPESKSEKEKKDTKNEIPLVEGKKILIGTSRFSKEMSGEYLKKHNSKKVLSKEEQNKKSDTLNNHRNTTPRLQDEIKQNRVSTVNHEQLKFESQNKNTAILKSKEGENNEPTLTKDKRFDVSPKIRRKLSHLSQKVASVKLSLQENDSTGTRKKKENTNSAPNMSRDIKKIVFGPKIDSKKINKLSSTTKDCKSEQFRFMLGNIKTERDKKNIEQVKQPSIKTTKTVEEKNKIKSETKKLDPGVQLATLRSTEKDVRLKKLSNQFNPLKVEALKNISHISSDEDVHNKLKGPAKNESIAQSTKNTVDSIKSQKTLGSIKQSFLLNLINLNRNKSVLKNENEIKLRNNDSQPMNDQNQKADLAGTSTITEEKESGGLVSAENHNISEEKTEKKSK